MLAPLVEERGGTPGLPFLGEVERHFGHPNQARTTFGSPSASHTINGHSIVLRVTFGRWRMLFAGDLNEQAELALVERDRDPSDELELRSEVLKVPHHGSADFLYDFLDAIAPVVSVVSSGDEHPGKEYIHPRATLMTGSGAPGASTSRCWADREEGGVRVLPPGRQSAHGPAAGADPRMSTRLRPG